jgi:hypothetical protein
MNIPAGHLADVSQVVAHFKNKHLEEEERKAKKLAASATALPEKKS